MKDYLLSFHSLALATSSIRTNTRHRSSHTKLASSLRLVVYHIIHCPSNLTATAIHTRLQDKVSIGYKSMCHQKGIVYLYCGYTIDWLIYCKDRCNIALQTDTRTSRLCCCSATCCHRLMIPWFEARRKAFGDNEEHENRCIQQLNCSPDAVRALLRSTRPAIVLQQTAVLNVSRAHLIHLECQAKRNEHHTGPHDGSQPGVVTSWPICGHLGDP